MEKVRGGKRETQGRARPRSQETGQKKGWLTEESQSDYQRRMSKESAMARYKAVMEGKRRV